MILGKIDIIDIPPETSEGHIVRSILCKNNITVNSIVCTASVTDNPGTPTIRPGPNLHGRRGGNSYSTLLRTKGGDGVVEIVSIPNFGHVRGPKVLIPGKVDLGSPGESTTLDSPWSGKRRGGRDLDLVPGREPEVGSIRGATDYRWIVDIASA